MNDAIAHECRAIETVIATDLQERVVCEWHFLLPCAPQSGLHVIGEPIGSALIRGVCFSVSLGTWHVEFDSPKTFANQGEAFAAVSDLIARGWAVAKGSRQIFESWKSSDRSRLQVRSCLAARAALFVVIVRKRIARIAYTTL